MNAAEYGRMYAHEDTYWWFVSRRELVVDLVRRFVRRPDPMLVDVGCGTGATAAALGQFGRVVGVDSSPLALENCRRRGLTRLIEARAEAIPLAAASADAIVATDVLEHLDDDRDALTEFRRILRPGGHAIVTVPAYRFLWSEHDEALMHRRRYVSCTLRERAEAAGFRPRHLGYALSLLFPLALGRLWRKPRRDPDRPPEALIRPVPGWLNSALIRLQRVETALCRRGTPPWGLSVVAVLEKPVGS